MLRSTIIFGLVATLGLLTMLAGCASPRLQSPENEAPLIVSGLRVRAPAGADWIIARHNADGIAFARQGARADHQWTAFVQTVRSPAPIDGYFQLARVVDRLTPARDSGRYRDEIGPVDAVDSLTLRCLARSTRVADYGPPPGSDSVRHVITAQEYFCRHPTNARLLVLVRVAERDSPQARFDQVAPVARAFLAGVGF